MTKEEMATMLTGREIGNEISKSEEKVAKDSGLFVIYGYSDDNVEIRGVEHEEIGRWKDTVDLQDGSASRDFRCDGRR